MWLFERTSEERDPHQGSPFYHVTQISYLPVPVPWTVYPHFHEADYELTFITRGASFKPPRLYHPAAGRGALFHSAQDSSLFSVRR